MIERIEELTNSGVDFAFETTLTTLSYLHTIKLAKKKGSAQQDAPAKAAAELASDMGARAWISLGRPF